MGSIGATWSLPFALGEGPFTIRFADVRYRALSPAGFWVKLLAAFLADLATKANAASALSKTR